MSDKPKTAVQWLIEQLQSKVKDIDISDEDWFGMIGEARLMEREQIKEAHVKGGCRAKWSHEEFMEASEQYYTETYGE